MRLRRHRRELTYREKWQEVADVAVRHGLINETCFLGSPVSGVELEMAVRQQGAFAPRCREDGRHRVEPNPEVRTLIRATSQR